jgi:hypothetical protein
MLVKDSDTFEEMIETQIELDYVKQPHRRLSFTGSLDKLSSSSSSSDSSHPSNEYNIQAVSNESESYSCPRGGGAYGVTDLITGISFMHNGEYIVSV